MKIIEASAEASAIREIRIDPNEPPQPFEPFMYRGRVYVRGPVPALVYRGEIQPLLAEIQRLRDEVTEQGPTRSRARKLARLIRRVYPIVKRFVEPALPGIRKRLWRLLPNPFRSEAGQLLGILIRGAWAQVEKAVEEKKE